MKQIFSLETNKITEDLVRNELVSNVCVICRFGYFKIWSYIQPSQTEKKTKCWLHLKYFSRSSNAFRSPLLSAHRVETLDPAFVSRTHVSININFWIWPRANRYRTELLPRTTMKFTESIGYICFTKYNFGYLDLDILVSNETANGRHIRNIVEAKTITCVRRCSGPLNNSAYLDFYKGHEKLISRTIWVSNSSNLKGRIPTT